MSFYHFVRGLARVAIRLLFSIRFEGLENVPEDDLFDLIDWMVSIGLPVTLDELGITDHSREHLMPAAELACAENDTLHNLPVEVNPEKVYNAMLAANAFGKAYLDEE